MKRLRIDEHGLDETDTRILRHLASNARTTVAEISRTIGLSPPSTAERVKRLEEAGVISSYTVLLDPKALGLNVAAWLRIRPTPGNLAKVADLLRQLPEIVECDRITGDDCFLAKAYVPAIQDLEHLIDRILPYSSTNTSIIQSSPIPRRFPILPTNENRDRSGATASPRDR